ncbi:putative acyl-CoA dehydrogenase [Actinoplanes missouriensis 431]|uniref:Putative acyl-CoA dehydrogenase n=1 Tax=Actinoplanes missouriensis (strain ATCC 14538 / DSM 43046 / CBS 188.64 / JCM 3121 / NBRC 102363 / NCIMB 12654 / NRRL B-3342 / UNCC 431) TaxID=512565 RepID=I0H286_ACTM4|nr:putative acyl-CoA dehydrogenase [Actinoplanes missouriensis 431]
MDFHPDETQQAISRLAAEVVAGAGTPERLWKGLGQAGLLTLGAPEREGGAGLGVLETALVLVEIGRGAAALPALRIDGTSLTIEDPKDQHPDWVRWEATSRPAPHPLTVAAACALGAGALAGALDLTARHIRTREQFGRPLATFQAVAQQIADVYIASRTLHLAVLSACWWLDAERAGDGRMGDGRTGDGRAGDGRAGNGRQAGDDLAVAAQWLTAEAPPALRACHHLHGGLGLMIDYPLHRHTTLIRDLVRFLGGAEQALSTLGERCVPRPD